MQTLDQSPAVRVQGNLHASDSMTLNQNRRALFMFVR